MSELPTQPELTPVPPASAASARQLAEECKTLRVLCIANTIGLVLISGMLYVISYKAAQIQRYQTDKARPMVQEAAMGVSQPRVKEFLKALQQFSVKHESFRPILAKCLTPDGAAAVNNPTNNVPPVLPALPTRK